MIRWSDIRFCVYCVRMLIIVTMNQSKQDLFFCALQKKFLATLRVQGQDDGRNARIVVDSLNFNESDILVYLIMHSDGLYNLDVRVTLQRTHQITIWKSACRGRIYHHFVNGTITRHACFDCDYVYVETFFQNYRLYRCSWWLDMIIVINWLMRICHQGRWWQELTPRWCRSEFQPCSSLCEKGFCSQARRTRRQQNHWSFLTMLSCSIGKRPE